MTSTTESHIVLLGDSIFDNRAYTGGEPDVVSHLRSLLPTGYRATLCAVDGDTTQGVPEQLRGVPDDATHLIVSVGGNDVLGNTDLLSMAVDSTAEALALFAKRVARFEADYRSAIADVLILRRPTTVCTIYNGNLSPLEAEIARIGLMTFNDVILRVAFEHRVNIIDLRLVCTQPADYANPIEPSGPGGLKIAQAILRSLELDDVPTKFSRVYR
jgi:hypothetical protein